MDDVDESLTSAATKATVHPALRAAAAVGLKTLNRYYSLSDKSECYRIAMGMLCHIQFVIDTNGYMFSFLVLHPQHKLKYFQDTKWLDDWIVNARLLVCNAFDERYSKLPEPSAQVIIT